MEHLPTESPIRVLLVNSSPLTLKILQQMLQNSPEIEVCGTAKHGREALLLLPALHPHVVCLSDQLTALTSTALTSLELTREIMSHHACPILVLQAPSGIETGEAAQAKMRSESVFELLQAGAVDVFSMFDIVPGADSPQTRQLIGKIKMLARVPVISRTQRASASGLATTGAVEAKMAPLRSAGAIQASRSRAFDAKSGSSLASTPLASTPLASTPLASTPSSSRVIAIGASTGGPQALLTVLSRLPSNYAVPVLCVQHISKGFIGDLVEWLNEQCQVTVKIAHSGEIPLPGVVYFPEEDRHLELDENSGKIRLTLAPTVDGHRPSVTVLFQSVARRSRHRSLAVLLTGMGCDGARGLKAVHDAHGVTLAQNQESCVVFGMPAAAIEMGAAQHVLSLPEIANKLVAFAHSPAS